MRFRSCNAVRHGPCRIGPIPKMPFCEQAPSGCFGLIPAWLVVYMKNFKKISTHLLTVLTKSYITYITNEKQISLKVSKEVCIKGLEYTIFQKEGIYNVKTKYLSGRLC